MPIEKASIPKRLIEAAKQGVLVPFVGAGLSRQAHHPFPNWHDLLESLIDFASNPAEVGELALTPDDAEEMRRLLKDRKFLMVAEALRHTIPIDAYETFLQNTFDPPGVKPAQVHKQLLGLNPRLIITTNYDRLLERAFAIERKDAATVYTYRDSAMVQKSFTDDHYQEQTIIFKIHGTINEPSEIILSERDYRKLMYERPGYRTVLSAVFIFRVVIMMGFSFADKELELLLETLRLSLKGRSSPDYILLPKNQIGAVEARRLRDDYGLQVIPYTYSSDDHPEVGEFVEYLYSEVKGV